MESTLARVALAAGLTALAGYGFKIFRDRQAASLREADRLAAQEWETDGGNNLARRPAMTNLAKGPGVTRVTGELKQPQFQ